MSRISFNVHDAADADNDGNRYASPAQHTTTKSELTLAAETRVGAASSSSNANANGERFIFLMLY